MNDKKLRELAERRVQLKKQFLIFLFVNLFLWAVWLIECVRHRFVFPWPIYPTLAWGMGLAIQYFGKYPRLTKEEQIEQEYQKLKQKDKK